MVFNINFEESNLFSENFGKALSRSIGTKPNRSKERADLKTISRRLTNCPLKIYYEKSQAIFQCKYDLNRRIRTKYTEISVFKLNGIQILVLIVGLKINVSLL